MLLLYNLSVRIYLIAIHIASVFNKKAGLWIDGRRELFPRLEKALEAVRSNGEALIWMHCASLGEFEQGRPVIEGLRKNHPETKILLTFFSPSGYEIRKDFPLADHVDYLPIDTKAQAVRFIEIVRPTLAIFVKYEFWFNHIEALHARGIPCMVISAIFRPGQVFFRWYGGIFREMLRRFDHIFVQNQISAGLLERVGGVRFSIGGDTRVDRVADLALKASSYPFVQAMTEGSKVLVAGSSWDADEEILIPFINETLPGDWKVIIAPHQIREEKIRRLEERLQVPVIRYSRAELENAGKYRVLIIDNIGMLAALYQYGRLAYIGGGFGGGIHNTLEPIAFGLPVIFGPRFKKFEEAVLLSQKGGAFPIRTGKELENVFKLLESEEAFQKASRIARSYIEENRGGTSLALRYIKQKLSQPV